MKILTSSQIRELDAYTIEHEPVSSWELMERASRVFAQWLIDKFGEREVYHIVCGMGNNGGDGLAVSRILLQRGYRVQTYIVRHKEKGSPDFETNRSLLREIVPPMEIFSSKDLPSLEDGIIVDALLGSGLNAAVRGLLADVITQLNAAGLPIVSIDIASGLFDDRPNQRGDVIIRPDYTVSFQCPRLCFVIPQCHAYVGDWQVVDIGLSTEYLQRLSSSYFLTTRENLPHLLKKRGKFSHKGTYGHAVLMAGSYGKMGAAVLSAKACLRSGAGLITTYIPKCGYEIMQISLPEAMVITDPQQDSLSVAPVLEMYSAVGIGPGIGTNAHARNMLQQVLQQVKVPLVLDADALNLLAENPSLLPYLQENTILTPHPKEFQRLVGACEDGFDMLRKAQDFSKKHKVIICLKGAHTAVVLPNGNVYFNTTGNPGMATAGSGDVLTGVILGLLSQGYAPDIAARLAVFKHGEAGDFAAARKSGTSLIASDLIEYLFW